MNEDKCIREPAVIKIYGPDDEEPAFVIEVPEPVIENPYPAERLEPQSDNDEEN